MRLYKYLFEIAFQAANNSDFPGDSRHVIFFDPDDRYGYSGRIHGGWSHMIKHLLEFKPEYKSEFANRFNKLVSDAKQLWIGPGKPKEISDRIFSLGTVLNSLDLINDKVELKKKITPVEEKIWNDIVVPYTKEYEKMVDDLVKSSTIIKPSFTEDEIKKLAKGPIGFPSKYHDINAMMYVNIPKGIVCTTTRDNKYAKTLYKTTPDRVIRTISKQTIAYENIKKALL